MEFDDGCEIKMIFSNSVLEKNNYSIEIDLVRDLQNISKQHLRAMGYEFNDNADEDWVRLFFNAQKRLISNMPRTVIKSNEFQCPCEYMDALKDIEDAITGGQNISKFMSKSIADLKYKDLLLFDWGIHHLHVSKRQGNDGFVKRSDYQLFALFSKDTAYFIQIYPHSKANLYTTQDMIRIIHENWPELIANKKIKGVLTQQITDADYELLRKAGISTAVEVGDENMYVSIGGGYASNGSSLEVTRNTDYWKELMTEYQKAVVAEVNQIVKAICELTNKEAQRYMTFQMIYLNDDVATLYEKANGVCLQLFRNETYHRVCFPQDVFIDNDYDYLEVIKLFNYSRILQRLNHSP
ncbi:MAG: hypothetical protein ACI3X1_02090 [Eubacteriales bacterium]